MLITRPNHDVTTNYLYCWSQKIIAQAAKSKQPIIDLKGKRANKKEFTEIIKKTKPAFIVINGHGDESSVAGHNNEVLVEVGVNEAVLSHAIVYARSCSCAKRLGPAVVAKGAKAFIGYSEDFVFFCEDSAITKPLNDKTAALFLESSNCVAIALLKGHSAGEANDRSRKSYENIIQKYMTSESLKEKSELLPYLFWDMKHQECLGDDGAVI